MKSVWKITENYRNSEIVPLFSSLEKVMGVEGDDITHSPISWVKRVRFGGKNYYVKVYTQAGKGLRKYIGRSRIRAEWENLLYFHQLSVPTAPVVAYGESFEFGLFKGGALITEELVGTDDLAELAIAESPLLKDANWVAKVSEQLSRLTRRLHKNRFVHNDLKWRNVLVTTLQEPRLFLIDCPQGRRLFGPMLQRGIIKDLACIDKVAKYQLSKTQRLRFYLQYMKQSSLQSSDKARLRKVLAFFEGRE